MEPIFAVLGSGSSGNCSFISNLSGGVLIDLGLGPRQVAARLLSFDRGWDSVGAAVLTHTHGDHWKEASLAQLARRGIPLHCHADHVRHLQRNSPAFAALRNAGLVRCYEEGRPQRVLDSLCCRSFAVSHDSAPTFGFRFDAEQTLFQRAWSLAYVADLGCWTDGILPHLRDVDVLALEFNHDEHLQRTSGRPVRLIDRVLGDQGHLSNEQAANLLARAVSCSHPGRLQSVIQLHLSRQCNCPRLATRIAQHTLDELNSDAVILTAEQSRPVLSKL
jgi:phosphoribosyl 1,2-cyclic phosphodiesterase